MRKICSRDFNVWYHDIRYALDPVEAVGLTKGVLRRYFDRKAVGSYTGFGRARRGASGALYPQSAIAGSNTPRGVTVTRRS